MCHILYHPATRERHLVVKCLTCGALKRFLARESHQLWSQQQGEGEEEERKGEEEREEAGDLDRHRETGGKG